MSEIKVHSCKTRTSSMQHFTSAFSALAVLVGWQTGHPITCKKLCSLILQCFDAVGCVGGRASSLKKTLYIIPVLFTTSLLDIRKCKRVPTLSKH